MNGDDAVVISSGVAKSSILYAGDFTFVVVVVGSVVVVSIHGAVGVDVVDVVVFTSGVVPYLILYVYDFMVGVAFVVVLYSQCSTEGMVVVDAVVFTSGVVPYLILCAYGFVVTVAFGS